MKIKTIMKFRATMKMNKGIEKMSLEIMYLTYKLNKINS